MRIDIFTFIFFSAFLHIAQAQTDDASAMDHSKMDHAGHMKMMAGAQRQADVSQRGQFVMPFSLPATTNIFTKTKMGGTQRVVAKEVSDTTQIKLVRQHLKEVRKQFLKADFTGPSQIHGEDMPGLADLKKAKPGQIAIAFSNVKGGAQLTYRTAAPELVQALHKWFDAQLSDHGSDAIEGHAGHEDTMKK